MGNEWQSAHPAQQKTHRRICGYTFGAKKAYNKQTGIAPAVKQRYTVVSGPMVTLPCRRSISVFHRGQAEEDSANMGGSCEAYLIYMLRVSSLQNCGLHKSFRYVI